ncbi:MAG: murein hydrolase activator EnvC family protein [Halocynthiibacter sp.]
MTFLRVISLFFVLLWGGGALAETAAEKAQSAVQMLDGASQALKEADTRADRVAALTQTIQAYEAGLIAMREGLRRIAVETRHLEESFQEKSGDLSQFLAMLQRTSKLPVPLLIAHPDGPLSTVRSNMLIADVTPEISADVTRLRKALTTLTRLRQLQTQAVNSLQAGLTDIQVARASLSKAIAERTKLPPRVATDPDKMAALAQNGRTLDKFTSALVALQGPLRADGTVSSFIDAKGRLAWPASGTFLRGFNEADSAGVKRPGVIVATEARAIVVAPWTATLRYIGPLEGYGNVAILEPQTDILLILAGLGEGLMSSGDIVDAGAPIALMTGDILSNSSQSFDKSEQIGVDRSESLYIELRNGSNIENPADWFVALEGQNE